MDQPRPTAEERTNELTEEFKAYQIKWIAIKNQIDVDKVPWFADFATLIGLFSLFVSVAVGVWQIRNIYEKKQDATRSHIRDLMSQMIDLQNDYSKREALYGTNATIKAKATLDETRRLTLDEIVAEDSVSNSPLTSPEYYILAEMEDDAGDSSLEEHYFLKALSVAGLQEKRNACEYLAEFYFNAPKGQNQGRSYFQQALLYVKQANGSSDDFHYGNSIVYQHWSNAAHIRGLRAEFIDKLSRSVDELELLPNPSTSRASAISSLQDLISDWRSDGDQLADLPRPLTHDLQKTGVDLSPKTGDSHK